MAALSFPAGPSNGQTYTVGVQTWQWDSSAPAWRLIAVPQVGVGAITSTMIADNTIVNADINSAAGIALTKLATGTSAYHIVCNGSAQPAYVQMTGDITQTNAGVTSISSGVIVDADINSAAAIAYSKLALSNSIVNADIATGAAITKAKLSTASGELGGAWVSTGLTFSNITSGAGTCYIMIMGKTLHFRVELTAGTIVAAGFGTFIIAGVTPKTGANQPFLASGYLGVLGAKANATASGFTFAADNAGANWNIGNAMAGLFYNGVIEID